MEEQFPEEALELIAFRVRLIAERTPDGADLVSSVKKSMGIGGFSTDAGMVNYNKRGISFHPWDNWEEVYDLTYKDAVNYALGTGQQTIFSMLGVEE